MIICPECKFKNRDAAAVCESCGAWIDYRVVMSGARILSPSRKLILIVDGTHKTFVFDVDQIDEDQSLTIGRWNPDTGETPDIDLSDVGAWEKGVSRKHAAIIRPGSWFRVMDTNSANGTYLNGRKLVPRQPRVIRDRDFIRLGHLVLRVKFWRKERDTMACTDRYGNDLQIGDRVVVVGETGEDNRWYIYQIEDRDEFQNITVLRWHPYGSLDHPQKRLPAGHMESRVSSNNDLVFQGRSADGWRIGEWGKWFLLGPDDGTPKWGTARFSSRMKLILTVQNTDKTFMFSADQINEERSLTIGRRDPDTGEAPDVDLHDFGAVEKGVSRKHATIVCKDGALQIMDIYSKNGTYLNGRKLKPYEPHVIRDGDSILLSHMVMRITFERERPNGGLW